MYLRWPAGWRGIPYYFGSPYTHAATAQGFRLDCASWNRDVCVCVCVCFWLFCCGRCCQMINSRSNEASSFPHRFKSTATAAAPYQNIQHADQETRVHNLRRSRNE